MISLLSSIPSSELGITSLCHTGCQQMATYDAVQESTIQSLRLLAIGCLIPVAQVPLLNQHQSLHPICIRQGRSCLGTLFPRRIPTPADDPACHGTDLSWRGHQRLGVYRLSWWCFQDSNVVSGLPSMYEIFRSSILFSGLFLSVIRVLLLFFPGLSRYSSKKATTS
ncbi:hypothetical protein VTI74DRAFT_8446 [Chaetomium olivicolor]